MKKPLIVIFFTLLSLLAGEASAFCFAEAAAEFRVEKEWLVMISEQESSLNPRAIAVNSDGSEDIGLMGINTGWLKRFPKVGVVGLKKEDLYDACTNVKVGAWVLAHNIALYGRTWKAIGAYNATSPNKRQEYINKVWARANKARGQKTSALQTAHTVGNRQLRIIGAEQS